MDHLSIALKTQVADILCDLLKIKTPGDMLPAEVVTEAILGGTQVSAITGLDQSKIDRLVAEGSFPAPVRLGDGKTKPVKGWLASEVVAWMRSRPRVEAQAA
jgi:predicted DNA-binding transcriptional regulator AlpA